MATEVTSETVSSWTLEELAKYLSITFVEISNAGQMDRRTAMRLVRAWHSDIPWSRLESIVDLFASRVDHLLSKKVVIPLVTLETLACCWKNARASRLLGSK